MQSLFFLLLWQGSSQGLVKADAGNRCPRVSINTERLRFNYTARQFFAGFDPPGVRPVFRGPHRTIHNCLLKLHCGNKTVFQGQPDPDIALSILQIRLARVNPVGVVEGPSFSYRLRISATAGKGSKGGHDQKESKQAYCCCFILYEHNHHLSENQS